MRGATGMWIIIATILLVGGLVVFSVMMSVNHWNFLKLGTEEYETNAHEISEEFKSLSIDTKDAVVVFLLSADETSKVVCYENIKMKHHVSVQNGILSVSVVDEREWYDHIGIIQGTPKITVYLPAGEYGALSVQERTGDVEIPKEFKFETVDISVSTGDVACYASSDRISIKTSTGDILVDGVSANLMDLSATTGDISVISGTCKEKIELSVDTGKTYLTDITCKDVISTGTTGKIFLKNVVSEGRLSIERNTGDVNFECCDANGIFVKTTTGDVKGSFLSDKIFIVESTTGKVNVPKTAVGDVCEISTGTGDIKIHYTN